MRKLLLSFFLIFGGFVVSAQSGTPSIEIPEAKVFKTDFMAIILPSATGTTGSYFLELNGGGITKTVKVANDVSYPSNTFLGLTPGTLYSVRARATACTVATMDTCTTLSPWSAMSYVTTKVAAPPAAVLKVENNCPQFVGLNWTVPSSGGPITNFIIKKSFGGPWYEVAQLPPYERSYYDNDVNPGVHTTYAIFTQNALNEIQESNNVSIQVRPYVAPDAPMNLRMDSSMTTNNSIKIMWDNPAEDLGCRSNIRDTYYIKVKRQFESEYTVYAYTYPQTNSFLLTGYEQNEPVEIIIWAISDQGIHGDQAYLKASTFGVAAKPSKVIGVAFEDKLGNSALGISWDHPEKDADFYKVEYSMDGTNWVSLATVNEFTKVINHVNISEGQKYTYRVKAGNYKYGESEWAYMDGYVMHDYTEAPKSPYALKAAWVGGNVGLTWVDDSNKEEKYVIERSMTEGGTYKMVGEVGRSVTMYTDVIGTDTSSMFYYRVYAENTLGMSAPSNVAKITKAKSGTSGVVTYPNPTVDNITITIPDGLRGSSVEVNVFNQANQLVATKTFKGNEVIDLNMKKLSTGMYNVSIKTGDFQETKKVYKF